VTTQADIDYAGEVIGEAKRRLLFDPEFVARAKHAEGVLGLSGVKPEVYDRMAIAVALVMADVDPQTGALPQHIILAGNNRQAEDYMRQQRLRKKQCLIVNRPDALRGLRMPFKVHIVGTYYNDRPYPFREEARANLLVAGEQAPIRLL
jgi:hypothetical protein